MLSDRCVLLCFVYIFRFLQIGNESCVDRLISQLKTAMPDMPDSLKKTIVVAVTSLALQYTQKSSLILGFLGCRLREEGSSVYKRYVVSAVNSIIIHVPSTSSKGKHMSV